MLEHRSEPVLNPRQFALRQIRFTLLSALVIGGSLGIGAIGYHGCEGGSWLDATYDAAMILTGMGPAIQPHSDSGKIFVTVYALFSAIVFLSASGLLITPLFHRIMHRLHLAEEHVQEVRERRSGRDRRIHRP